MYEQSPIPQTEASSVNNDPDLVRYDAINDARAMVHRADMEARERWNAHDLGKKVVHFRKIELSEPDLAPGSLN